MPRKIISKSGPVAAVTRADLVRQRRNRVPAAAAAAVVLRSPQELLIARQRRIKSPRGSAVAREHGMTWGAVAAVPWQLPTLTLPKFQLGLAHRQLCTGRAVQRCDGLHAAGAGFFCGRH